MVFLVILVSVVFLDTQVFQELVDFLAHLVYQVIIIITKPIHLQQVVIQVQIFYFGTTPHKLAQLN